MRFLKILFLSMAAIGLMAGAAMAGSLVVNASGANSPYTISLETLGTFRGVLLDTTTAAAAVNGALSYVPGQDITTNVVVSLAFTGGAFNGQQVLLCDASANRHIAIATPAAGTTSQGFIISTLAGAGNTIYMTGAANCGAAAGNQVPVRILAATTTGFVTATVTSSVGGSTVDSTGSANVARIRSEYAAAFNAPAAHVTDYLGSPGTGTNFTVAATGATNLTAGTNAAANITRTGNQFGATNGSAVSGPTNPGGLTVGSVVSLTDSQAWQGIAKVFLSTAAGAGNCADSAGSNAVGTGAPNGTVALTIPAASFNGSAGMDATVCLLGNGSVLSIPRTIAAGVAVNVTGTGANSPAASALNNIDAWSTNAYQAFVGWLVNAATVPTFCLISNNDTAKTATVLLDIVSNEGTVVIGGINLGTIPPKTAKLATFTGNSVSLAGGTATDLTTLGANNRYVGKLTTTVNPANATVTCIQTDPATGVKRAVPTYSNSANTY